MSKTIIEEDGINSNTIDPNIALPLGAATAANQTNGLQKTHLVDAFGNVIESIPHDNTYWLATVNLPAGWALAAGQLANHEVNSASGYNAAIGTTREDVWPVGGDYVFPTTAITMEVDSTSAADAGTLVASGTSTGGTTSTLIDTGKDFVALGVIAGDALLNDTDGALGVVSSLTGTTQINFIPQAEVTFAGKAYRVARAASTGAAIVEIHGLDANYAEIQEYVITNGTTAVSTVNQFLRMNNFHVMHVGTGKHAAGNITVQAVGGATIYDYIAAGFNNSSTCVFTVPADVNLYMTHWKGCSAGTRAIRFFIESNTDYHDRSWVPSGAMIEQDDLIVVSGTEYADFDAIPMKFPPKADIKISGYSYLGNGEGSGGFRFWLEPA